MALDFLQYRSFRILGHVLFWTGYILLVTITLSAFIPFERALFRTGISFVFHLILTYTHLYILIPRFLIRQKWVWYGLTLLLLLSLIVGLRMGTDHFLFHNFKHNLANAAEIKPLILSVQHGSSVLISSFIVLIITIPIRLLEDWRLTQLAQRDLTNRKLEAELKFLKTQVNPHFLFNTLNNIYSLAFTGSEQTAPMIMKLSEMMRYMIYDCAADEVSLDREIRYLYNYIELQQIKTEGKQQITFEVEGNPESVMVSPLLFVPLFENAFKHGNLEDLQRGSLSSHIHVSSDAIRFKLVNTIGSSQQKHPVGGIGLENIQKRLQLRYPGRHTFHTEKLPHQFTVDLTLELS